MPLVPLMPPVSPDTKDADTETGVRGEGNKAINIYICIICLFLSCFLLRISAFLPKALNSR